MFELPPIDAVASASLAVGALFLLRYHLVMRRIWREQGHRPSFQFDAYKRTLTRNSYGDALEPERRYAARQLVAGLGAALIGLGLFGWLAVLSMMSSVA